MARHAKSAKPAKPVEFPNPADVRTSILREPGMLLCSNDYRESIADMILPDVVEDIAFAADADRWNDDDVRLAVGRALYKKLIGPCW